MKKAFTISFVFSFLVFFTLYLLSYDYFFERVSADNPEIISRSVLSKVEEDELVGLNKKLDIKDLPKGIRVNTNNELLFLLMGVDSENVAKSKGTRTDTMMLCKMNFDTGKIDILSIPRDTRVKVRGKEDKINHAHAYGGSKLSVKTVEDFLDINIDYYVKVDYRAVIDIVDAIGGVELEVPIDMHYEDPVAKPPLSIHIDKGLQVLDGQKAHDYLRYRKGYKEGDLGRVKAQQVFMKALLRELTSPKNIFKIPKLIKTYYDYVDTNIPMTTILRAATNVYKVNTDSLNTMTIKGEGKMIKEGRQTLSYYIYDKEDTKRLVEEHFYNYKR